MATALHHRGGPPGLQVAQHCHQAQLLSALIMGDLATALPYGTEAQPSWLPALDGAPQKPPPSPRPGWQSSGAQRPWRPEAEAMSSGSGQSGQGRSSKLFLSFDSAAGTRYPVPEARLLQAGEDTGRHSQCPWAAPPWRLVQTSSTGHASAPRRARGAGPWSVRASQFEMTAVTGAVAVALLAVAGAGSHSPRFAGCVLLSS